jgi:hypothetical protein
MSNELVGMKALTITTTTTTTVSSGSIIKREKERGRMKKA